jgi:hypothetical protein
VLGYLGAEAMVRWIFCGVSEPQGHGELVGMDCRTGEMVCLL